MENLKATESLQLIQSVIELRKRKYEENGLMLLFWGTLVTIAGVGQFIMIKMGKAHISGLIWLVTMLPGFIFTFVLKFRNERKKVKALQTPDYLGWIWSFAGVLALINSFVFMQYFAQGVTLMIFTPLILVGLVSAINIKNVLWIVCSLSAMVIAYFTIFIPFLYHSLMSALISLVMFVVPGLSLYINHKKNSDV